MFKLRHIRLNPVLVASCVLLAARLACFANLDVWLTTKVNSHKWPGTSSAPFYAGDAEAFTAILVTNRNCTFHYAAGTYQTLGWRWQVRATAQPGCTHLGAGPDRTIIQLVGAEPGCNGCIFGNDGGVIVDNFEVHDMTLDCNAVNNATYTNGYGACHAVNLGGNNILLDGLKVIHFGTGGTNTECFPVGVGPLFPPTTAQTNIQNVILQNSWFTSPAPTNACGLTCCSVGGAAGWNLSNVLIRNCTVSNVDGYFPNGPHAFSGPLIENCLAEHCFSGVYFEPGYLDEGHRDWMVRSNVFRYVNRGIYISYNTGQRIRSLTIEGNQFLLNCSLSPLSGGLMVNVPEPLSGEGTDWLVLKNNTVSMPNCSETTSIGFDLTFTSQAVVVGNQVTFPTSRAIRLDSATVPARWISGNIDANQMPLVVTNGVLGSVSSQAAASLWQEVKPPTPSIHLAGP